MHSSRDLPDRAYGKTRFDLLLGLRRQPLGEREQSLRDLREVDGMLRVKVLPPTIRAALRADRGGDRRWLREIPRSPAGRRRLPAGIGPLP